MKTNLHSSRLTVIPLIACGLAIAAFGNAEFKNENSAKSGSGTSAQNNSQLPMIGTNPSLCGPPSYNCSYDGTDPKPLCTNCNFPPVPDMNAEPNAVSYDKTFGITDKGNQIIRCTYPGMNGNNNAYGIGFGGSGDSNAIGKGGGSPISYRLI